MIDPSPPTMTFTLASHRLLVVCAHPDDESFGLGAVIAAFVGAGTQCRLLCLTHGEASALGAGAELPRRRSAELSAAADTLGIAEVQLLDHPDGSLSDTPVAVLGRQLDRILDDTDLILTFDPGGITGHPDHRAATRAAVDAGRRHDLPVLGWSIPDDVAAQLNSEYAAAFVGAPRGQSDIVLAVDRIAQHAAMAHHASQLENNPVPLRRLELQGDLELLCYLHRPEGMSVPAVHALACALDDAVAHARAAYPGEICGLIGGRDHRLDTAVPVDNVATPTPGQCGFHMHPTGQLRATRALEDRGLDVTGIYLPSAKRTGPVCRGHPPRRRPRHRPGHRLAGACEIGTAARHLAHRCQRRGTGPTRDLQPRHSLHDRLLGADWFTQERESRLWMSMLGGTTTTGQGAWATQW